MSFPKSHDILCVTQHDRGYMMVPEENRTSSRRTVRCSIADVPAILPCKVNPSTWVRLFLCE